jgi:hypothetical protein
MEMNRIPGVGGAEGGEAAGEHLVNTLSGVRI